MEIPDNILKDLQYYLSRSVLWDQGICANIVAEEAACGNELAIRAMEAREFVLNIRKTKAETPDAP